MRGSERGQLGAMKCRRPKASLEKVRGAGEKSVSIKYAWIK